MVDRHDDDSPHASFWAALPSQLGTVLGMGQTQLKEWVASAPAAVKEEALKAHKVWGVGAQCLGASFAAILYVFESGGSAGLCCTREATCQHALLVGAVQHVRERYASLKAIIETMLRAYPQHIKPAMLSEEAWLWAVQLWWVTGSTLHAPPYCHCVVSLSAITACVTVLCAGTHMQSR
jgi:hypothetical protein